MASNKYWEQEQPVEVSTVKNVFRLFRAAGKLQISMPNWTDSEGNSKPGKTITLDITALKATSRAVELLNDITN
jgi:hypothetical protein